MLGALLQEEYKLQHKVRRDIQSLEKKLLFMNATLLMVAEEPTDKINPLLRTWATLIKELSYDMEDVVNTFMTEVHGNGTTRLHLGGLRDKAFNMVCMGATHHWIAGMIEEMKSLTKELTELRARYRLDDIHPMGLGPQPGGSRSRSKVGAPRAGSYGIAAEDLMARRQLIRREDPVGVRTELVMLRHWLEPHGNEELPVLSITGFSGVGKTTFATTLYQDSRSQFDCRASVIVSQKLDQDEVFMDILHQMKPQESAQEQQGSCSTRRSEKKGVVPLLCLCSHGKQGNDNNTSRTQSKIQTTSYEQLTKELKTHLSEKSAYMVDLKSMKSTKLDGSRSMDRCHLFTGFYPPDMAI